VSYLTALVQYNAGSGSIVLQRRYAILCFREVSAETLCYSSFLGSHAPKHDISEPQCSKIGSRSSSWAVTNFPAMCSANYTLPKVSMRLTCRRGVIHVQTDVWEDLSVATHPDTRLGHCASPNTTFRFILTIYGRSTSEGVSTVGGRTG
jgi:hypothetical protein